MPPAFDKATSNLKGANVLQGRLPFFLSKRNNFYLTQERLAGKRVVRQTLPHEVGLWRRVCRAKAQESRADLFQKPFHRHAQRGATPSRTISTYSHIHVASPRHLCCMKIILLFQEGDSDLNVSVPVWESCKSGD